MTEAGLLIAPVGVSLAFTYSLVWLYLADRAGGRGQPMAAAFHAAGFAMVAFPLLVEATTRFQVLPAAGAALGLALLSACRPVGRLATAPGGRGLDHDRRRVADGHGAAAQDRPDAAVCAAADRARCRRAVARVRAGLERHPLARRAGGQPGGRGFDPARPVAALGGRAAGRPAAAVAAARRLRGQHHGQDHHAWARGRLVRAGPDDRGAAGHAGRYAGAVLEFPGPAGRGRPGQPLARRCVLRDRLCRAREARDGRSQPVLLRRPRPRIHARGLLPDAPGALVGDLLCPARRGRQRDVGPPRAPLPARPCCRLPGGRGRGLRRPRLRRDGAGCRACRSLARSPVRRSSSCSWRALPAPGSWQRGRHPTGEVSPAA